MTTERADDPRSFVLLTTSGQRSLARLSDVVEVVPMMTLQAGRGSGAWRGMLNLRGDIVPVFDFGAAAPLSAQLIVLLRGPDGRVGLVVDEVDEVVELSPAAMSSRPVGRGKVAVVGRVGDDILPVVDVAEIVDAG